MAEAIDSRDFRTAMGMFATGVTVVGVSHDGDYRGMTANAFSSLSLNPPLILVCVDEDASMFPIFREIDAFSVNILAHDQEQVSRAFAAHGDKPEPMLGYAFHEGERGTPLLDDALAWAECSIEERHLGGDHLIVVGKVHDFSIPRGDENPLLFYRGKYHDLGEQRF